MAKKVILVKLSLNKLQLAVARLKTTAIENCVSFDINGKAISDIIFDYISDFKVSTKTMVVIFDYQAHAAFRFYSLPSLKESGLSLAVTSLAKEMLSLEFDSYVYDYRVTAKTKEETRIMLAAVKKKVIMPVFHDLTKLGLKPLCFDIFENALADYFLQDNKGISLILHYFNSKLTFIFLKDNEIIAHRYMEETWAKERIRQIFGFYTDVETVDSVYFVTEPPVWVARFFKENETFKPKLFLINDDRLAFFGFLKRKGKL